MGWTVWTLVTQTRYDDCGVHQPGQSHDHSASIHSLECSGVPVTITRTMNVSLIFIVIIIYADDTVLYTSYKASAEGLKVMEENLGLVTEWRNNNTLTVNITKTKHMIVGDIPGDTLVVRNQLCHNNQQIEMVTNYNYLGVELDSNLTMENHINKCVKNANKKMFMVSKLRRCLT